MERPPGRLICGKELNELSICDAVCDKVLCAQQDAEALFGCSQLGSSVIYAKLSRSERGVGFLVPGELPLAEDRAVRMHISQALMPLQVGRAFRSSPFFEIRWCGTHDHLIGAQGSDNNFAAFAQVQSPDSKRNLVALFHQVHGPVRGPSWSNYPRRFRKLTLLARKPSASTST